MSGNNTEKTGNSQEFGGIHFIEKMRGETLAALLERFRMLHNLSPNTKLTYAGRLDPLAEGVMIVLAGDARFKKDQLLGLDKEYVVEVLLGVRTDSLDPLGIVQEVNLSSVNIQKITHTIEEIKSITTLPYPLYSSTPVDGVPLFAHARAGRIVAVPQKKIKIYDVQIEDVRHVPLEELISELIESVEKVAGDFRQVETITKWKEILEKYGGSTVTLVRIRVHASSGTYMRSLAEWIGKQLEVPALAYKIKRLKIATP